MRKTSRRNTAIKKKIARSISRSVPKSSAGHKGQTSLKELRSKVNSGKVKPKRIKTSKTSKVPIHKIKRSITAKSRKSSTKHIKKTQFKTLKTPPVSPLRTASVKQYESAVKLLYAQEFEKAKTAFEKIIQEYSDEREVLERAKIHLKLCELKIGKKLPTPRTVEDHYNLAVALMNNGKYEESIEHLKKALRHSPDCEYVLYALAATNCLTGNLDGALNNLKAAISLKPENRFLAQHDSDFEPLMQDSRFISIVYPERMSTPPR